ncbi:hypothetical protein [Nocardia sp. NRRL S-836]|uniref:hypothetical protein n=1 Tax=Nocardia sp. NRRL S-836 TaxID=1519492 RepID=UPI000AF9A764|nr:hypothetical protein [Nocardia sp. NRRL S-836]
MWSLDDDDDDPPRPADEAFWGEVAELVGERGSVLLEEVGVRNAERWHRLRTGELGELRRHLTPRAGLLVWPELDVDVQEVLRTIRDDDDRMYVLVWEDRDGHFRKALARSEDHLDLYLRLAQARGAMANSFYAHEHHPLLAAVLPDDDGVVRSDWRP